MRLVGGGAPVDVRAVLAVGDGGELGDEAEEPAVLALLVTG